MPGPAILRRKPIDDIEPESSGGGLQRTLGLRQLTAIGIGGIIGAGIFSLAGAVAHETAGPAVVLSFLIAGVASAAAAFSYAEFAGLIPKAGSAYTYGYVVLGEFAAWFIGWDLLLEYTAIVAVVAIGISGYFNELLGFIGVQLPPWMLGAPGTESDDGVAPGTYVVNLFAVLLCLLIAFVLNRGMKGAARFETDLVVLKVAIVLLVVVVGVFYIDAGNYDPFTPFGLTGAFTGAATVFFAVFGYDAMSTAAEESEESQKHMPKAIIYSLAISMVLYVLACLVLTGMVDYTRIDSEAAFSAAFADVGLPFLGAIIAAGAILGILTVLFTFLMGAARVGYSMSRDGLLPPVFATVHPRFRTPHVSTILIGTIIALVAGLTRIEVLGQLVSIGTLLAFVLVSLGIIILRKTMPGAPRPFRTPGVPWVPVLGALICLAQMVGLPLATWERLVIWLAIGLVVYFTYSRSRPRPAAMSEARAGVR